MGTIPLSDEALEALCAAQDVFRIERVKGEIFVNAPAGGMTSDGNAEIVYQLRAWWRTHRRGRVFESSGGFFLPDGSLLNPDASYLSERTLAQIPRSELQRIPHLVPDFVIELLSITDARGDAERKLARWMRNGVQLAWLVDPYQREVVIANAGETRTERGLNVHGTGPVEGFVLDLAEVWQSYE